MNQHLSGAGPPAPACHGGPLRRDAGEARPRLAGISTINDICVGTGVRAESLVGAVRRVQRRQLLFCAGQSFGNLFSVRSGFFKTVVYTQDGREHVTGFQMPGDLLGLDGVGLNCYSSEAEALETSEVCVIPFERVSSFALDRPLLHLHLLKAMAREIVKDQAVILMLAGMNANERVATFLVDLLHRSGVRGWSGSETVLRMSRQEIGSYLGLTLETVSRALSLLSSQGLISIQSRHIRVIDPVTLRGVPFGHEACPATKNARMQAG